MSLPYSEEDILQATITLENVAETISQLIDWNYNVSSTDFYYASQNGMQLLAANCTLITAIGEGINRVQRILPGFLTSYFPDTQWRAIIGMRNHIAHGYFEVDAEIIFDVVKNDIPQLQTTIQQAISILNSPENKA